MHEVLRGLLTEPQALLSTELTELGKLGTDWFFRVKPSKTEQNWAKLSKTEQNRAKLIGFSELTKFSK